MDTADSSKIKRRKQQQRGNIRDYQVLIMRDTTEESDMKTLVSIFAEHIYNKAKKIARLRYAEQNKTGSSNVRHWKTAFAVL